ncbi:MAG: hypothetical protein EHM34_02385 [Nitrosopumilales archaeon]|nr:MAG: hypothetical protein EHM34_02385 [Nitrosopumilales archaeon]
MQIIDEIKKNLNRGLLRGKWKNSADDNLSGHCYVATEALYWLLGAKQSTYRPYVLSHRTCPELLNAGETHWFLMNPEDHTILDPTAEQFGAMKIPYEKAVANGMMNYPEGGSRRAKQIIEKISQNKFGL